MALDELVTSGRILLLLFPLIAILMSIGYGKLTEDTYPPIVPSLTLNTLIQAATIIGTSIVINGGVDLNSRGEAGVSALGVLLMIFLLFIVMMFHSIIFSTLRSMTLRHITDLLSNEQRFEVKSDCISKHTLLHVATLMITVDVIPHDVLSAHQEEQRKAFAELLQQATTGTQKIDPNEFLISEKDRERWARYYKAAGVASFVLFLLILAAYLSVLS